MTFVWEATSRLEASRRSTSFRGRFLEGGEEAVLLEVVELALVDVEEALEVAVRLEYVVEALHREPGAHSERHVFGPAGRVEAVRPMAESMPGRDRDRTWARRGRGCWPTSRTEGRGKHPLPKSQTSTYFVPGLSDARMPPRR